MIRTPKRSGFTLYELIVTITIIQMLVALPVPGILAARKRQQELKVLRVLEDLQHIMEQFHAYFYRYPTMEDFEDENGPERKYLESVYSPEHPIYWEADSKKFRVDYEFDFEFQIDDVINDPNSYETYKLCAKPLPDYSDGMFSLCLTSHRDRAYTYDVTYLSQAAIYEMEASRMMSYRALLGATRIAGLAEDPTEAEYVFDAIQLPEVQEIAWNVLNLIKEEEGSGRAEVLSVSELREFARPQATDSPMIAETRSTVYDVLTIQGLNEDRFDELSVPLDELKQQPVEPSALLNVDNIELLTFGMFGNEGVRAAHLAKFQAAQVARDRGDWDVAADVMNAEQNQLTHDRFIYEVEDVELLRSLTHLMSPQLAE